MELILSDEQRLLYDSAAKFFARDGGVKRARKLRGSDTGFDRDDVGKLGETGWLGMLIAEDRGGLQLGPRELALVMEQAGRVLAPEPVADLVLAALLVSAGDEASGDFLGAVLKGETAILPALQDLTGGIDLTETSLQAARHGAQWRLNGGKGFVLCAGAAGGFVVSARDTEGLVICHVPRSARGLDIELVPTVDGRPYGTLTFRDGAPSGIIARGNTASDMLRRYEGLALVAAAAEMLGVMEGANALTLDYLRTRKQFGRPIGSFQALQHRAVDNYVLIESTRSLLHQICEGGEPIAPSMASALKAVASSAALTVTKSAVQLHGAIGFTDEYDIGLYLKRAMWLSSHLGNEAAQRRRYAQLS